MFTGISNHSTFWSVCNVEVGYTETKELNQHLRLPTLALQVTGGRRVINNELVLTKPPIPKLPVTFDIPSVIIIKFSTYICS